VTARIDLGDLSHLTDEDAELYAALYWERNRVSRGELARVQRDAAEAHQPTPAGCDACHDSGLYAVCCRGHSARLCDVCWVHLHRGPTAVSTAVDNVVDDSVR
jgi:hypothetical protein